MAEIRIQKQPHTRIKREWSLTRKIRVWLYQFVVPLLGFPLIRALSLSYRWRVHVPAELLDFLASGKPFAVAIWHGDMLLIQSLGRHLGFNGKVAVMVALSQAGEVEARILQMLGYHVVRGSEKKRGKRALDEMIDLIGQGAIPAFVVDGPSGPPGRVKPGVVRLAQRCRVPVLPIAFLRQSEWRLPTWDATRIPRPFSRCIGTSMKPIAIPEEIADDEFDAWADRIRRALHELQAQDVSWSQARGTRVIPRPRA